MINTAILSWVTFIYLAAFVFYFIRIIRGETLWGRLATITLSLGFAAQTVALILRWVESYHMGIGHAPLSNFYESLIFFSWTIVLLYLIFEWRIKNKSLGTFVVPVVFIAMAFASLSPNINNRIQPLAVLCDRQVPALDRHPAAVADLLQRRAHHRPAHATVPDVHELARAGIGLAELEVLHVTLGD